MASAPRLPKRIRVDVGGEDGLSDVRGQAARQGLRTDLEAVNGFGIRGRHADHVVQRFGIGVGEINGAPRILP